VVLFMKGTPSAPQCGFSRGVVQILQAEKVDFDAHDVIADNELRNEIKVRFSATGPAATRVRPASALLSSDRRSPTGPRFRSSTLTASLSAATTLSRRCSPTARCALRSTPSRLRSEEQSFDPLHACASVYVCSCFAIAPLLPT